MPDSLPILVAVALDSHAPAVVRAGVEIARRLERAVLPVHASRSEASPDSARARLLELFGFAADAGVTVLDPIVRRGDPTPVIVEEAARARAHMIVAGPGRPETVVQWLLGSTSHNIVRHATQPVFLVRGTLPGGIGRQITCPVDMSPQSRLALTVAIRMARVFESALRVIYVVPPDHQVRLGGERIAEDGARIEAAEAQLREMLDAHDTKGIDVEIAVVSGRPSTKILEHSLDAQLVVIGSRAFRWLLPGTFGSTTEKVLRKLPCSVLTIRDPDPYRDGREDELREIARLRAEARECLDTDPERTIELVRLAMLYAPTNAALHDLMANALEKLGEGDRADAARDLAARIRKEFH